MLEKLRKMGDWFDHHSIFIMGTLAMGELFWFLENRLKNID